MAEMIFTRDISPQQREWRNQDYSTYRQHTLISEYHHQTWLDRIETDPGIEMFGIEVKEDGAMPIEVGTCGLTYIRWLHGTAEYSLLIARSHRKKGYGTQALRELLRRAFTEFNLNCVYGEIYCGNIAGLKVAKDCGLQVEGTLQQRYFQDGRYVDTISASITKEQWLERQFGHMQVREGSQDEE